MGDADDELRRRLTGAGTPRGGAGPAGDPTMLALSVVSGDVRELQVRLEQLSGQLTDRIEAGDRATADKIGQRLGQEADALRAEITAIGQGLTDLSEAVDALQQGGGGGEEKTPPPQPWDWASMDWRQEIQAVQQLIDWLPELYAAWRPAMAGTETTIPSCWAAHPDMCRALSAVHTAYQQAFKHPERRPHHESDFYRVLHDRLADVAKLAALYRCYSTDPQQPHRLLRETRTEQAAQQTLRRRVLAEVYRADMTGDADGVAALMEEFGIDAEELRDYLWERFTSHAVQEQEGLRIPARLEAARLLVDYTLVPPEDQDLDRIELVANLAEDLAASSGGEKVRARLEQLLQAYGPMLRRQAARWLLPLLQERARAQEAGELAEVERLAADIDVLVARYGVTDADIQQVWREQQ